MAVTTKNIGELTKEFGRSHWSDVFSSVTLASLLRIFSLHSRKEFYQLELAALAGSHLYSVQRELERLERVGLVTATRRGNRVYYRANSTLPAFEDLKRFILKTLGLGDSLRAAFAPLASRVSVAFIYGSYAQGTERADSDIDLFIIGDLSSREAAKALGPVARSIGRELNPTLYPSAEFSSKFKHGNRFIRAIVKESKIFLIGDDHVLKALTR